MGKKKNNIVRWLGNNEFDADRRKDDHGSDKKKNKKEKKKDKKRSKDSSNSVVVCKKPRLINPTPTLSDKEIREVHEAAKKTPKVPKEIQAKRDKCNHATEDLYTIKEYEKEFPYSAYIYTPFLKEYVTAFGEENIAICTNCLEVLPHESLVTPDEVAKGLLRAMAAIDHLTASTRMSKSEIAKMKEMKADLAKMRRFIVSHMTELCRVRDEFRQGLPANSHHGGPTPVGHEGEVRSTTSSGLSVPKDSVM